MRRPYAWESALIVFFFLMLLLGINLVFGVLQQFTEEPFVLSPILIIGELLILALVVVWAGMRRLPWRETFYLRQTSWQLLALSVLLAGAWWLVATALAILLERLFSLIGPPPEIPPPVNSLDALGYFVAIVFLAPICEEPFFRGFVMRGWLRYGFIAGMVGSGVLFGLQHAQLTAVIPISIIGVVLGIMAFRADSLWPPVIAHAVYNGLGAPFLIWPDAMPEISDASLLVAGAAAAPVAILLLWLYHRLAPPFQPPQREPLSSNRAIAIGLSLLLVLLMYLVMISFEIFVRLNPQLTEL